MKTIELLWRCGRVSQSPQAEQARINTHTHIKKKLKSRFSGPCWVLPNSRVRKRGGFQLLEPFDVHPTHAPLLSSFASKAITWRSQGVELGMRSPRKPLMQFGLYYVTHTYTLADTTTDILYTICILTIYMYILYNS